MALARACSQLPFAPKNSDRGVSTVRISLQAREVIRLEYVLRKYEEALAVLVTDFNGGFAITRPAENQLGTRPELAHRADPILLRDPRCARIADTFLVSLMLLRAHG